MKGCTLAITTPTSKQTQRPHHSHMSKLLPKPKAKSGAAKVHFNSNIKRSAPNDVVRAVSLLHLLLFLGTVRLLACLACLPTCTPLLTFLRSSPHFICNLTHVRHAGASRGFPMRHRCSMFVVSCRFIAPKHCTLLSPYVAHPLCMCQHCIAVRMLSVCLSAVYVFCSLQFDVVVVIVVVVVSSPTGILRGSINMLVVGCRW